MGGGGRETRDIHGRSGDRLRPGSEGVECAVTRGSQQLNATIGATYGWENFKTVTLGQIKIEKAGQQPVVVKALRKPGPAVMNLQATVLKLLE